MVERVEVRAAISSKPPRRVPVAWWCAAVFVLAISAYSLRYVVLGDRAYEPDLAPSFRARPLTVMAHTLFGRSHSHSASSIFSRRCGSDVGGRCIAGSAESI